MPISQNSPSVLSEDVGEVDSFLGQDPPNSSLSVLGLTQTSASNSAPSSRTNFKSPSFFHGHEQSFVSQNQFEPQPVGFPHQPKTVQGYSQPFSVTHPLPTSSPSSYAPSSSPVLQVAPVSSDTAQVFPSVPSRSDHGAVINWSISPQQQGPLQGPTILNPTLTSITPADTVASLPETSGHQTVPLFETPPLTGTSSQIHQGIEVSPLPSVPLVPTSPQNQQTQCPVQPGYTIPRSAPISSPPVATIAPLAGTTNTYRLGSQRKPLYAQPPGLSVLTPASASPVIPITSSSNLSFSSIGSPYSPVTHPVASSIAMSSPEMSVTATLTPMQLPSSTSLQYQSPVIAENQSPPSVLPPSFTNLAQSGTMYRPVYHHWFFKKEVETKVLWHPFSMVDSLALEEAFTSTEIAPETLVSTDGGRYDVNILRRQRSAVYWQENPTEVRRCSWFYKGSADTRYVPYEENVSTRLEEEFRTAVTTNSWHRRVEFPNGETVVFHGPTVIVHFLQATSPDAWGNTPQTPLRPRVVKRGVDEFDIDEGEPAKVDHLLFLVHGIGSVCDLKFRTVEEVVDEFRSLALQLVQSHFHTAMDHGKVSRIEVLPISWHATLHGEDTGIDRKLKSITLNSIPKLRHFTNDTLLDILFYTSPVYCQTIMHTVGDELNRLYSLFKERNPAFKGGVSLGGHSLGSLILFDLLYHQKPPKEEEDDDEAFQEQSSSSRDGITQPTCTEGEGSESTTGEVALSECNLNHRISYVMGNAGTGQPFITYPQLHFQPKSFFALGSPIGMFVTVRGIETLGEDFRLPTCPGFFNIFHPFDPVAYRIETLVNSELTNLRPVLIPHHKGRKRMHLELKETMARVGADLKQRLMESVRNTWNTVYQLAMFHRSDDQALEQEVDKVLEEQLQHQQQNSETESTHSGTDGEADLDVCVGQLNGGRRIDYVLQEAPLESFNEYLFALKTHVCYWESEDTMLMMLKEIYGTMGIAPDSHTTQQKIPMDRPSASFVSSYSDTLLFPTIPNNSDNLETKENGIVDSSTLLSNHNSSTFQVSVADLQSPSSSLGPSAPVVSPYVSSTNHIPVDISEVSVGMDPTAPVTENKNLGPPPISGFIRKP